MRRFERALNRGLQFGATLGVVLALFGLMAGAPLFAGGFSGALFGGAMMGAVGEAFAGIVVGAVLGGITFGAVNATVQIVPGLDRLLGAAPPRYHARPAGARTRQYTRVDQPQLEEADDRNVDFRRMIEEGRIAQAAMQGNELN